MSNTQSLYVHMKLSYELMKMRYLQERNVQCPCCMIYQLRLMKKLAHIKSIPMVPLASILKHEWVGEEATLFRGGKLCPTPRFCKGLSTYTQAGSLSNSLASIFCLQPSVEIWERCLRPSRGDRDTQ